MRESDVLAPDVRALIREHIPSPLHLEALVALARERERAFTPAEVGGAKYPDSAAVTRALRDLVANGLAAETEGTYRLAPQEPQQTRTLELLVIGYDRMPVQVVRAVYERPPEAVQSFADAFRLGKPK